MLPQVLDDVQRLVEENFRSDVFVAPETIEREMRERIEAIVRPTLSVGASDVTPPPPASSPASPSARHHDKGFG